MVKQGLCTIAALTLLLTGCGTGYGPAGEMGGFEHGGYTDKLIDNNTALVTFRGNESTSPGTVKTFLLYRCAQVTQENGYNYFIITSSSNSLTNTNIHTRDKYLLTTPPRMFDSYYLSDVYQSSTLSGTSTPGFYPEPHGASAVIKMFNGRTQGIPGKSYNANDVITHLGPATF